MKHFLFILAFFITLCSFRSVATAEEASSTQSSQQFLNPIFNERMIGIAHSSNGWDTFLTPSSVIYVRDDIPNATNQDRECHMIDQTSTRVLIKCVTNDPYSYTYPKPHISYNMYISTGPRFYQGKKNICGVTLYFTSMDKPDINTQDFKNFKYVNHIIKKDECGPFENNI